MLTAAKHLSRCEALKGLVNFHSCEGKGFEKQVLGVQEAFERNSLKGLVNFHSCEGKGFEKQVLDVYEAFERIAN